MENRTKKNFGSHNFFILEKMKELKIYTVWELCLQMGYLKSDQGRVWEFIKMKTPPFNKDGSWCSIALRMANFFGCSPDELFSAQGLLIAWQKMDQLEKEEPEVEVPSGFMLEVADEQTDPFFWILKKEREFLVSEALKTLSERQKLVVVRRYGFESKEMQTLDEVGDYLGVSIERTRQIQLKALRKLRDPYLRSSKDEYFGLRELALP